MSSCRHLFFRSVIPPLALPPASARSVSRFRAACAVVARETSGVRRALCVESAPLEASWYDCPFDRLALAVRDPDRELLIGRGYSRVSRPNPSSAGLFVAYSAAELRAAIKSHKFATLPSISRMHQGVVHARRFTTSMSGGRCSAAPPNCREGTLLASEVSIVGYVLPASAPRHRHAAQTERRVCMTCPCLSLWPRLLGESAGLGAQQEASSRMASAWWASRHVPHGGCDKVYGQMRAIAWGEREWSPV